MRKRIKITILVMVGIATLVLMAAGAVYWHYEHEAWAIVEASKVDN